MLYAREVPKTGGDTLFASMYAAYDALSHRLKATLEGLKTLHSSCHVFRPAAAASRDQIGALSLQGEPRATKQPEIALFHSQRQCKRRLDLIATDVGSWGSRRPSP